MQTRPFLPVGVAALLLLAGCAVTGGQGMLGHWFGRKAAAEQAAAGKVVVTEDAAVTAAQIEVVKTGVAIGAASLELPENWSIKVAQRTNANAAALLNQRQPLTLIQNETALATVNGLLSKETAKREAAEKAQLKTEDANRDLSEELVSLRAKLEKLGKEREAEAAQNLALANELRWSKVMQYAGAAGSFALGLLAIAYRLNVGRLQEGLGSVLAHVQEKQGVVAATAARTIAGVVLHTGEQKKVFQWFSKLTDTAK